MGPLGMGEIVVLFILALLVFGPKKLPELGKTFGKGLAEFKRASTELKSTFQKEMDQIERETKDVKSATGDVSRDINKSYYYDDNEDDYYSDYDYGSPSGTGAKAEKQETGNTASKADGQEAEESGAGAAGASEAGAGGDSTSGHGGGSGQPVSGLPDAEDASSSKQA